MELLDEFLTWKTKAIENNQIEAGLCVLIMVVIQIMFCDKLGSHLSAEWVERV